MGYQGFMLMLNDWPDNEFVEDEERREDSIIAQLNQKVGACEKLHLGDTPRH